MIRVLVDNVYSFDVRLSRKIAYYTGKRFVDKLMRYASKSGDGHLYAVFGALLLAADPGMGSKLIAAGALALAIELVIQKVVKHLVKRERPGALVQGIRFLVDPPDRFSFPSGHTAGAFLMATVITSQYPMWALPLYIWAALVGFSRVYNGVHFPTDVVIGCALGLVTAWIGLSVVM
ncbi:MAG TPA: phosphatase PAP2 family protein [Spirochaetota bacterium]|nr:phosphatase PAP2 family protein [Spirochaetota bacterium]